MKRKLKNLELNSNVGTPYDLPPTYEPVSTFDWKEFLNNGFDTPSVSAFPHAPLSDVWESVKVGLKIEVPNQDYGPNDSVFWIASVIKFVGYKSLVRYIGLDDSSNDFWINLCCKETRPLGWCSSVSEKCLLPPICVAKNHPEISSAEKWREFLKKRLHNGITLPLKFEDIVRVSLHVSAGWKIGLHLEAIDGLRPRYFRPGVIESIVSERVLVKFLYDLDRANDDEDESSVTRWFHYKSLWLRPYGYAIREGLPLAAPDNYKRECKKKISNGICDDTDASESLFEPYPKGGEEQMFDFQVGMKLEAQDPRDLDSICVCSIDSVFSDGWLLIVIDGCGDADKFLAHRSSPLIFPVGFCSKNDIKLTPPKGSSGHFIWSDYLKQSQSQMVPMALFNTEIQSVKFKVGQKIECTDMIEPNLVCVGTICDVRSRLIKVHFDGWEKSLDQWQYAFAPDLFPVGWAEMVGYNLQAPKENDAKDTTISKVEKSDAKKQKAFSDSIKKRRSLNGAGVAVANRLSAMSGHAHSVQEIDGLKVQDTSRSSSISPIDLTPDSFPSQ